MSTTTRGYGAEHQQARAQWAPHVEAGLVDCSRCGHPITPGTPWDLGHDDNDRSVYRGPEHAQCNRGAAGRRARANDRARRSADHYRPAPPPSPHW